MSSPRSPSSSRGCSRATRSSARETRASWRPRSGRCSASEALAASEEALGIDPALAEAHVARANVLTLAGRSSEAEEEFRTRGLALVDRALELKPDDFGVLYNAACTNAIAGELDRALELLDRAVATGSGYRSWIEHDSDLDALRDHPRFEELLARLPP